MKINLRIRAGKLYPADDESKEQLSKFQDADYLQIDIKNMDGRSIKQNAAYWKWCNMIAKTLNEENINLVYKIDLGSYYNKDIVHETITKKILKDKFKKDSTTKLNKDELDGFIDEVVLWLSEQKIEAPEFPSLP